MGVVGTPSTWLSLNPFEPIRAGNGDEAGCQRPRTFTYASRVAYVVV